ncbi:hypothetical protein ACFLSQ_06290 [Bacteroidota bacterium]
MNKLKYTFLIFAVLLACNEQYPNSPYADGTSGNNGKTIPTGKVKYFPDEAGSYWIYETFQLDSNNGKISNSISYDSVIVEGELLKAGKKAKLFVTYTKQSGNYSKELERFYSIEDKKLYSIQSYLGIFLEGFPINIVNFSDEEWVKIVDPEDDLWRIYRLKFEDAGIPDMPFLQMSGKIDILASWEGTKTFNIKGKSVIANEYLMTFELDADIDIPLVGKLNISVDRDLYQYYADDIGLIQSVLSSSEVSFPLLGGVSLPGFESTIIRYNAE